MPRTRKADLFEGYVRSREPDMKKMAELTARAKGNRSLVEFADACGLNMSTLSRIINMKNTGPSVDDVLARIARNADPESGVTIEDLLEASGKERIEGGMSAQETMERLEEQDEHEVTTMAEVVSERIREYIPADAEYSHITPRVSADSMVAKSAIEYGSIKKKTDRAKRLLSYQLYLEASVYRQSVLDALVAMNYQVSLETDQTAIKGIEFDCYADFKLKTNALDAEGLDKWAFIKLKETGNRAAGRITSYFGMMFVNNPVKDGTRITLIIEDKATYDILRNMLEDVEIPASFSLMLLDTKDRKVVSEFVMDRSDGVEPVRLFNAGGPIDWEEIFGTPDED